MTNDANTKAQRDERIRNAANRLYLLVRSYRASYPDDAYAEIADHLIAEIEQDATS
jgi:hypothetical protein